jgi:sRNA-binding carbon storage regulator CsrA
MLVSSRRVNETICIPSRGIEAPPEVKVVRCEPIDSSAPVAEVVGPPRS